MDNGTVRPRPDSLNTLYYVSQRTRLKFDFKKEKYQLRLTIQDVRIWGNGDIYTSTGVFGSTTGLDVQEAWFRLKAGESSHFTIGRQVLKLDDQRLIAGRNWNQFGISYDALKYEFNKQDWDLDVVVSYNNMINVNNGKILEEAELFNKNNLMKTTNYIHLKRKFNKNLQASVMAVGAGYQSSKSESVIYMMGTYGLWMKYDNGKFDLSTNIYYQNGHAQSGKHSLAAFYHKFYLANPALVGGNIIDDTDLGAEVDLMYTYKIMSDLVLQAGASYYFTTSTLEAVKNVSATGINSPYWGWVMITFTPELFKTK